VRVLVRPDSPRWRCAGGPRAGAGRRRNRAAAAPLPRSAWRASVPASACGNDSTSPRAASVKPGTTGLKPRHRRAYCRWRALGPARATAPRRPDAGARRLLSAL